MKHFKEAINWVVSIALAMVLAVLLNAFVFQPTEVLGSSMEPTLRNGEMVFLSKLTHTLDLELGYGDIVVIDSRVRQGRSWKNDIMESPLVQLVYKERKVKSSFWIKRVIGKPGDTLEIKEGKVYRNGQALDEPYLKEPMNTWGQKFTLQPGEVFLMGDNRNNSQDSRVIGPVPIDHVLGKMIFS